MDTTKLDQLICAEIPEEYVTVMEKDTNGKTVYIKKENPLYHLVSNTQLHGPCGHHNPSLSCMRDGYCRFNFPKDYISKTEMSDDGYPLYRKRDPDNGGQTIKKYRNGREYIYTNKDVVPYNKYLLLKYQSHVNLEYCQGIVAIKYHLKYINKGHDVATISINEVSKDSSSDDNVPGHLQERNEVAEFQHKRYIAGAEASWRLRCNEVAERKPAVIRLKIHLKDQQIVYFDANEKDQSINRINRSEKTHLTSFFDICKEDSFAKQKLYRDIPEYYTWQQETKTWQRRKRDISPDNIPETIGRLYSIHPSQIELFSLRLLLNNVRGPTSFKDLRTVDGQCYSTFQEAAIKRNLCKDDSIWINCMKEENDSETNIQQLRQLFVTILVHCEVSNHKQFYLECRDFMNDDFVYQYKKAIEKNIGLKSTIDNNDTTEYDDTCDSFYDNKSVWNLSKFASKSALCKLEILLKEHNKRLCDFNLPTPNLHRHHFIQNAVMKINITEDGGFTPEEAKLFFEANIENLNQEQKVVFDTVKTLIDNYQENKTNIGEDNDNNNDGHLVFLDAPGGTGKTFTLNIIICYIKMQDLLVAASASSGIAANLLYSGKTAHKQFSLPFHVNSESTCNISKQSPEAKFLQDIVLGIIDEGPMLNKLCYEALHRTMVDLADKKDKHKKFGGKIMLISGDFRQLLPVMEKANRSKIVNHTLKYSSDLWDDNVIKLSLKKNMRVHLEKQKHPDDFEFHEQLENHEKWLLNLGEDNLIPYHTTDGSSIVQIPNKMCCESMEEVIESVFDNFDENIGNPEYF